MKKLFSILTVLFIIFGYCESKAQGGLNNNSDFKVPIPVVAPPLQPNFGFDIVVPMMPPFFVPADLAPMTVTAANYLPQIPVAPAMPKAPESSVLGAQQGEIDKSNLPKTIVLPPLPQIPSNPRVRLAIY